MHGKPDSMCKTGLQVRHLHPKIEESWHWEGSAAAPVEHAVHTAVAAEAAAPDAAASAVAVRPTDPVSTHPHLAQKNKNKNEKEQISKNYFLEKYKYIKAVKYEIERMLSLNCFDKKSINLIFKNDLNLKLLNGLIN